MDTLAYILTKWNIGYSDLTKMPIEIPNTGRVDLARLFGELGFEIGAEIGVERGIFSETLCVNNQGVKLFCVDYWDWYDDYHHSMAKDGHLPRAYKQAQKRLKPHHNVVLVKDFSMRAVRKFEDGSLDFVYIDANHEMPWVMEDIVYWSDKVRSGGIVAGHDYIRFKNKKYVCHVIQATNLYTHAVGISPWFLLGTRAKEKGQIRDNSRSWFWVKP